MDDTLAAELYAEWRRTQDPSVVPAWGNVDQEARESWERVANLARRRMAQRFVASIDRAIADEHGSQTLASGMRREALNNLRAEWAR